METSPMVQGKSCSHLSSPIKGSSHSPSSGTIYSDRFIPSRSSSNFSLFGISDCLDSPTETRKDNSFTYKTLLQSTLYEEIDPILSTTPEKSNNVSKPKQCFSPINRNIFRFKTETRRNSLYSAPQEDFDSRIICRPIIKMRKISQSPFKTLDAPGLEDDFYMNLVDWSSKDILAVGLGECVYLWNAHNSKVTKLCDFVAGESICSVSWANNGTHLALGTKFGKVEIWDASCHKKVQTLKGHKLRVNTFAWNESILSSGGKGKSILQHDIRSQEDIIGKLVGHTSDVCGLKWSYDGRHLASGGNDNKVLIWNHHSTSPIHKNCNHIGAVKAIAWSPHLFGLLASGGGSADRCIRIWNTLTDSHLNCVDTGSQVCNLLWSKNTNEFVSTHGYSHNEVIVWHYPSMFTLAKLKGHSSRVTYLCGSSDGKTIVTGAGDETLRFWNVFPSIKYENIGSSVRASSFGRTYIR